MKTPLLVLSLAILELGHGSVMAQANYYFANYLGFTAVPIDAPVFGSQGDRLEGTNHLAELWGGASPDALAPLVETSKGRKRIIAPFLSGAAAGYIYPQPYAYLCILGVPDFGWGWLQMRAWDARLGATYEQVAALGHGGYGESPLFYAQGASTSSPNGAYEPAPLIGLQSFSLRPAAFPATPGATRLVATTAMQVGFATNGFTTNGFALCLVAATNATYVTEFSTDLRTWAPLSTNHVVDTVVWVRDFGATNSTARFYRARFLPGQ